MSYKLLITIVILFNSCSKKISLPDNIHCYFDSENLTVTSSYSKDTLLFSFNLSYHLAAQFIEFGTINCMDTKFFNADGKRLTNNYFTISNIGCKDTLWAKKVLREELKKRCPFDYSFSDSFCIRKHYEVKMVDSSKLVKSLKNKEEIGGYISGGKEDFVILYGTEYKDIGEDIVPRSYDFDDEYSGCCRNSVVKMLDSWPGKYDLKIYSNVYEQLGEAAHIKMIRDSLGFDVKWVKDEIVPYKIITYKKKSIE